MVQLFLLHPFIMLLGMAAQYAGLIVLLILMGFWCFRSGLGSVRSPLRQLGWCFIVAWSVWPLCNALAHLFPLTQSSVGALPTLADLVAAKEGQATFAHVGRRILTSLVPTGVLLSGVALVGFSYAPTAPALQGKPAASVLAFPLQTWIVRLGVALGLVGIYLIWQHLTGFDVRTKFRELPNMMFPDGRYRVLGFSGHPLTTAGMYLAMFGWCSFFLVSTFRRDQVGLHSLGRAAQFSLGLGAVISAFAVFASGGRTALAIALASLLPLGVLALRAAQAGGATPRRLPWAWLAPALAGVVALLAYVLGSSPIALRFVEFFAQLGQGQLPNRVVFWKVHLQMFGDAPLWGQGLAPMTSGLRRLYYDGMGYGDFPEKYNAHNMIFETLASVGIVGTVVVAECLRRVFIILRTLARGGGVVGQGFFAAFAFAVALNALHGLTQNVFYDSGVMMVYLMFFWVLIWQVVANADAAKETTNG